VVLRLLSRQKATIQHFLHKAWEDTEAGLAEVVVLVLAVGDIIIITTALLLVTTIIITEVELLLFGLGILSEHGQGLQLNFNTF